MKLLLEILNPVSFFMLFKKESYLLFQLVQRNLFSRYKGSLLGLFWSFVQPLMMLCVYTFVFSVVFKARWGVDAGDSKGAFAVIMFSGITVFNIFAESVTTSCGVIVSNPNYVKKVVFPLEILPLAQVLSSFLLSIVWFLLLFLGTVFILGKLSFTLLLLPLVLLPLFFLTLGISFFVASLGVYIRDTSYAIQVILQILFFMTPIFYPIEAIPEKYRLLLQLNPLTVLIEEVRKVFLFGQLPNWTFLGVTLLVSLVVLQLGFVWFRRTRKGFADVI